MGWTTVELEFDSMQEQEILLFSVAIRPTLGPTQHPIQWVPWFFAWNKAVGV
jgi:hypothetical protein